VEAAIRLLAHMHEDAIIAAAPPLARIAMDIDAPVKRSALDMLAKFQDEALREVLGSVYADIAEQISTARARVTSSVSYRHPLAMWIPEEAVMDKDARMIRRISGYGAVLSTKDPVGIAGSCAFEVLVDYSAEQGSEGVEVGVTTSPGLPVPLNEDTGYAIKAKNSWVSSDAGSLWVKGSKRINQPKWKHTCPSDLCSGDIVRVEVSKAGNISLFVNDMHQVTWRQTLVPKGTPLYALVGLRAPCCGATIFKVDRLTRDAKRLIRMYDENDDRALDEHELSLFVQDETGL